MAKKQPARGTKDESVLDSVKEERDELQQRLSYICELTGNGKFQPSARFLALSPASRILLERQKTVMQEYRDILDVRIELMEGK